MIFALDGHDGSGKTTLARALADRVGARCVRPFAGAIGAELMRACDSGEHAAVIEVGEAALSFVSEEVNSRETTILDRGWLTVSTLVPRDIFAKRWRLWFPTALIWCDLPTTISRLEMRTDERNEVQSWHARFLRTYLDRRTLGDASIIRTDLYGEEECLLQLNELVRQNDTT